MSITEVGRTRLYTRRERARRTTAIAAALLGVLVTAWVAAAAASWLGGGGWQFPQLGLRPLVQSGSGGLLGLPAPGQAPTPGRAQFPVTVSWPATGWATTLIALPLWIGWFRVVVVPILRGLQRETRHRGLASLRVIRRSLGAHAARRAGSFTLPETPWWMRLVLPTSAFGIELGRPIRPAAPRQQLVANWEQRIRIIARTGWGKTARLLVPAIRALPGPAVISSNEPKIFEQTVLARQFRRTTLRWGWLTWLLSRWLPVREYPVATVDVSDPANRWTAGYPSVQWNPLDGAADFAVARRRAAALLNGVEDGQNARGGQEDSFFRDSSTAVLAAWLHAADLGNYELHHLSEWLKDTRDTRPRRVLQDDPRADKAAEMAIREHLDPVAERTNSGVKRYLALALDSLTSDDGVRLCGRRFDDNGQRLGGGFDMTEFILAGGTVYVLADSQRIDRARPLLDLFASEFYYAAERAALGRRGKRLPLPFMGMHDEVRYGITISALPYAGSALRKYNVGYVYSVQSSSQEDIVYGPDAPALRDAAGVSVVGGIDISSARELSDRAGPVPVVTPTRGDHLSSEHVVTQEALTIADQQELADSESVIVTRGAKPFIAHTPSYRDRRRTRRQIDNEAQQVARAVAVEQAREDARRRAQGQAGDSGADL